MENSKILIVGLIMLLVGLGIGYKIDKNQEIVTQKENMNVIDGMHRMEDGSMMSNSSNSMQMADMMSTMNYTLKGKTGDEFDKAFLEEMIIHHEGAVGMAKLSLTNGNRKEIKDLAITIINAQNKEIEQMKAWQKAWFNK